MSLKSLLGLENFPVRDSEIMRRLEEARRNHEKEVVFRMPGRTVKVTLAAVNLQGLMRDYEEYYKAG